MIILNNIYNMFKISRAFKFNYTLFARNITSALYVTGNKASSVHSVLVPFIDIDNRLKSISNLHHSLKQRGICINVAEIIELWEHYKELKEMKQLLEIKKVNVSEKIKRLMSQKHHDVNHVNQLKLIGKFIRKDLKTLSNVIWSVEENVIVKILKLPNDLHANTSCEEIVIHSFMQPISDNVSHLEIAKKMDVVDFINPYTYFLKNTAAAFELALMSYFTNAFIRNEFISVSCPDFTKSVILEGCGLDDENRNIFKLARKDENKTDEFYLNGGASNFPFCSYHTKHIIDVRNLPLCYVTKGRQYTYNKDSLKLNDLYSVWQNNAVHVFIGSSEQEISGELSNLIEVLTGIYKSMELPFRITYAPANKLSASEKLRVCFQMHSSFHKKYVDAGHISLQGDFFSKRLRMYYSENDEIKFLHVLSGSVVNVPTVLACALEYRKENFIPPCLEPYIKI